MPLKNEVETTEKTWACENSQPKYQITQGLAAFQPLCSAKFDQLPRFEIRLALFLRSHPQQLGYRNVLGAETFAE